MTIKGVFLPDHIQVNKFQLSVPGLPPLTPISIGELESELDKVELPDRTTASGGREKAGEFELVIPAHHTLEIAAMELWVVEGLDPISPLYKKIATLFGFSQSTLGQKSWMIGGAWASKRALPAWELDNDGEMANITYTISYDEVIPLT